MPLLTFGVSNIHQYFCACSHTPSSYPGGMDNPQSHTSAPLPQSSSSNPQAGKKAIGVPLFIAGAMAKKDDVVFDLREMMPAFAGSPAGGPASNVRYNHQQHQQQYEGGGGNGGRRAISPEAQPPLASSSGSAGFPPAFGRRAGLGAIVGAPAPSSPSHPPADADVNLVPSANLIGSAGAAGGSGRNASGNIGCGGAGSTFSGSGGSTTNGSSHAPSNPIPLSGTDTASGGHGSRSQGDVRSGGGDLNERASSPVDSDASGGAPVRVGIGGVVRRLQSARDSRGFASSSEGEGDVELAERSLSEPDAACSSDYAMADGGGAAGPAAAAQVAEDEGDDDADEDSLDGAGGSFAGGTDVDMRSQQRRRSTIVGHSHGVSGAAASGAAAGVANADVSSNNRKRQRVQGSVASSAEQLARDHNDPAADQPQPLLQPSSTSNSSNNACQPQLCAAASAATHVTLVDAAQFGGNRIAAVTGVDAAVTGAHDGGNASMLHMQGSSNLNASIRNRYVSPQHTPTSGNAAGADEMEDDDKASESKVEYSQRGTNSAAADAGERGGRAAAMDGNAANGDVLLRKGVIGGDAMQLSPGSEASRTPSPPPPTNTAANSNSDSNKSADLVRCWLADDDKDAYAKDYGYSDGRGANNNGSNPTDSDLLFQIGNDGMVIYLAVDPFDNGLTSSSLGSHAQEAARLKSLLEGRINADVVQAGQAPASSPMNGGAGNGFGQQRQPHGFGTNGNHGDGSLSAAPPMLPDPHNGYHASHQHHQHQRMAPNSGYPLHPHHHQQFPQQHQQQFSPPPPPSNTAGAPSLHGGSAHSVYSGQQQLQHSQHHPHMNMGPYGWPAPASTAPPAASATIGDGGANGVGRNPYALPYGQPSNASSYPPPSLQQHQQQYPHPYMHPPSASTATHPPPPQQQAMQYNGHQVEQTQQLQQQQLRFAVGTSGSSGSGSGSGIGSAQADYRSIYGQLDAVPDRATGRSGAETTAMAVQDDMQQLQARSRNQQQQLFVPEGLRQNGQRQLQGFGDRDSSPPGRNKGSGKSGSRRNDNDESQMATLFSERLTLNTPHAADDDDDDEDGADNGRRLNNDALEHFVQSTSRPESSILHTRPAAAGGSGGAAGAGSSPTVSPRPLMSSIKVAFGQSQLQLLAGSPGGWSDGNRNGSSSGSPSDVATPEPGRFTSAYPQASPSSLVSASPPSSQRQAAHDGGDHKMAGDVARGRHSERGYDQQQQHQHHSERDARRSHSRKHHQQANVTPGGNDVAGLVAPTQPISLPGGRSAIVVPRDALAPPSLIDEWTERAEYDHDPLVQGLAVFSPPSDPILAQRYSRLVDKARVLYRAIRAKRSDIAVLSSGGPHAYDKSRNGDIQGTIEKRRTEIADLAFHVSVRWIRMSRGCCVRSCGLDVAICTCSTVVFQPHQYPFFFSFVTCTHSNVYHYRRCPFSFDGLQVDRYMKEKRAMDNNKPLLITYHIIERKHKAQRMDAEGRDADGSNDIHDAMLVPSAGAASAAAGGVGVRHDAYYGQQEPHHHFAQQQPYYADNSAHRQHQQHHLQHPSHFDHQFAGPPRHQVGHSLGGYSNTQHLPPHNYNGTNVAAPGQRARNGAWS